MKVGIGGETDQGRKFAAQPAAIRAADHIMGKEAVICSKKCHRHYTWIGFQAGEDFIGCTLITEGQSRRGVLGQYRRLGLYFLAGILMIPEKLARQQNDRRNQNAYRTQQEEEDHQLAPDRIMAERSGDATDHRPLLVKLSR